MRPPPQHPIESRFPSWSFSDESAPNTHVSLGFRVRFNVPGWIVGAAFLESPLDAGHHTCELRTEFADPLHVWAWTPSPTGAFEGAYAWVRRRISSPWKVEADVVYQWLCGYEQVRYGYELGALTDGLDLGDVHVMANNYDGLSAGGVYQYGYPFEPGASNGGATLYSVDVIFQPK